MDTPSYHTANLGRQSSAKDSGLSSPPWVTAFAATYLCSGPAISQTFMQHPGLMQVMDGLSLNPQPSGADTQVGEESQTTC